MCSDRAERSIVPASAPDGMGHTSDASAHDRLAALRPVVLILVGVPGAGKSTFSAALQAAAPGRWDRVNQVNLQELVAGTCHGDAVRCRTSLQHTRHDRGEMSQCPAVETTPDVTWQAMAWPVQ